MGWQTPHQLARLRRLRTKSYPCSAIYRAAQRADVVDLLLRDHVVVETPHGKIRFLNHSRLSYTRAATQS